MLLISYELKTTDLMNAFKAFKVLQRSVSISEKEVCLIYSINAAAFQTLVNRLKKNHIEVFIILVKNINKKLIYNTQCNLDSVNLSLINETA